jgi:hypothetical protein
VGRRPVCQDIDSGRLTEEEAVALLCSFYRLIDHLDCETDGRVIVGGYGRRNPVNADRFCLPAIEACKRVKEVLPQFTLRFNSETPPAVWNAALACIEAGRTYPLLYNDDVLVPGMMKAFGVDRKPGRDLCSPWLRRDRIRPLQLRQPQWLDEYPEDTGTCLRGGYEPMTGPAQRAGNQAPGRMCFL